MQAQNDPLWGFEYIASDSKIKRNPPNHHLYCLKFSTNYIKLHFAHTKCVPVHFLNKLKAQHTEITNLIYAIL